MEDVHDMVEFEVDLCFRERVWFLLGFLGGENVE